MTIVSQRSWKQYIVFPIFFVIFTICALFLLQPAFKERYVNLQFFLFDLIFVAFAIVGFAGMLKFDKILIEGNQLYVYSVFGRRKAEIYLPAVTSWAETENMSKGSVIKSFTLFNDVSKYTFKSNYYKNYDELKAAIIPYGVQDDKKAAQLKGRGYIRIGAVIFVMGLLIAMSSLFFYFYQSTEVPQGWVAIASGIVANTPEINAGSKGGKSIDIRLQNYPDFIFQISGSAYNATDAHGYVTDVRVGDSLFIILDRGIYERKFLHLSPLTFKDKYWDYSSIQPYGIYTRSKSFLVLEDYNRSNKNFTGSLIAGLVGMIWIGLGWATIKKGNKQKAGGQH